MNELESSEVAKNEAMTADINALVDRYGREAVQGAFSSFFQEQKPADNNGNQDAKTENSENPALNRLSEILDGQDMPYYMQVNLLKGEEFHGRLDTSRRGYDDFDPKQDWAKAFYHLGMGQDMISQLHHNAFSKLDSAAKNHNESLSCVLINNIDDAGHAVIGLNYITKRTDELGRKGANMIHLYFSNGDAAEVLNAILEQPSQALEMIKDKIDPEFNSIQPANITEVHAGKLNMQPGEKLQTTSFQRMERVR